jgi:hypothetical protein
MNQRYQLAKHATISTSTTPTTFLVLPFFKRGAGWGHAAAAAKTPAAAAAKAVFQGQIEINITPALSRFRTCE